MYATTDSSNRIFPIVKKISADPRGSDANVIVIISIIAVKTPPSAWPDTTAVTYSDGNCPDIPRRSSRVELKSMRFKSNWKLKNVEN